MRDHARIEELIAIRALGGLEAQDERALADEMASHGPDCTECRRLEDEYHEVAGRLAFSLDPVPVPGRMEDELVERAVYAGEEVPLRVMTPGERRRARRGAGGIRLRPLVAIAAALVLFVGGLAVGASVTGGGDGVDADARVVAFEGEPGTGTLTLTYTPGESGVTIVGADLPAPQDEHVYQVWTLEGSTPTPGPCVVPEEDGSLVVFVDAEVSAADAMAVTVEPATCSTQPTTTPIYVADLTTA